ncbi:hypothetical protein JB92DRAFT_2831364 [Gautieria morchelliformis]|nr:hypothetical protein JB92DRAFT_2831364 [Gautieria morchelliformis]
MLSAGFIELALEFGARMLTDVVFLPALPLSMEVRAMVEGQDEVLVILGDGEGGKLGWEEKEEQSLGGFEARQLAGACHQQETRDNAHIMINVCQRGNDTKMKVNIAQKALVKGDVKLIMLNVQGIVVTEASAISCMGDGLPDFVQAGVSD